MAPAACSALSGYWLGSGLEGQSYRDPYLTPTSPLVSPTVTSTRFSLDCHVPSTQLSRDAPAPSRIPMYPL